MTWAKAKYGDTIIDNRIILSTLEFLCESRYSTVYQVTAEDPNQYIVVFKDQRELHDLLKSHTGCIFGLKFLKRNNSKFSYTVNTPHGKVVAVTLAEAVVLMSGTLEDPRNLYVTSSGNVIIE